MIVYAMLMRRPQYKDQLPLTGFSLVELSIVLVILGLLVGGILAGKSLVRASELRSVSTDLSRYKTAIATFKGKYFYLPGDLPNATSFWGAADVGDGLGVDCYDTDSTGQITTCNGNGDGSVSYVSTSYGNEKFRFWQHLANAGLIEGNFSGRDIVANGTAQRAVDPNFTNIPRSKFPGGGFDVISYGSISGYGWAWDGYYGLTMYFGKPDNPADLLETSILTPQEMWNIDTKMDDGLPAYGVIRAYKNASNCNSNASQATAAYLVGTDVVGCMLMFVTGF